MDPWTPPRGPPAGTGSHLESFTRGARTGAATLLPLAAPQTTWFRDVLEVAGLLTQPASCLKLHQGEEEKKYQGSIH